VRTSGLRSRLRVVAPIFIAGTLVLGAGAVAGFEPGGPQAIAESAFQPVVLPSPSPATLAAPAPVVLRPSPNLGPLADLFVATDPPPRAQPDVPEATPFIVPAPTPTATPTPKPTVTTTHSISGLASWYCRAGVSPCTSSHPDTSGFNAYAAAGPRLRRALGSDWRGSIVYVDGIRVKLIDWCQCYEGQSNEKLLDLYYDVFSRVGGTVRIRW
jgi:hypothetical protein